MALPRSTGKVMITLAALITGIGPARTDWNETHVFSKQWSPHARFHGAAFVGTAGVLSAISLRLLWGRSSDRNTAVTVAALMPVAYWSPFLLATRVPGTGIEDPGVRQPRIAGIPSPIFYAAVVPFTSSLGWYLDRRLRMKSARS